MNDLMKEAAAAAGIWPAIAALVGFVVFFVVVSVRTWVQDPPAPPLE